MKKFKKLSVNTPLNFCDEIREAIGNAGAGKISGYSHCSFSTKGKGRSIPGEKTKPHLGQQNILEITEEEKIETFCDEEDLLRVVAAIKKVHPYEEPVVTVENIQIY